MNSPLWPSGICDTEAAGREKVRIGRNCDLELCLPGELYIMKLKKERYSMLYDMELIAHKLVRWENFIHSYRLPRWEEIPDFGLYMEQVVVFLSDALCFMPAPESPKERLISAAAINNYVRLRLMPAPVKKRYYRVHLAYLLMIFTLKQSLSIRDVQRLTPADLSSEQVEAVYADYAERFRRIALLFTEQTRNAAQGMLCPEQNTDATVSGLAVMGALVSAFARILAEKIVRLQGADTQAVLALEEQGEPRV